jgi:glutamate/tyrosine decarboxylase-like PLP-dependent enzyme
VVAGGSRSNTGPMSDHEHVLKRAHDHATSWLGSLDTRAVPPQVGADAVADALGHDLPEEPSDSADVVDLLASACEPGLVAMPSGRFFGFVIGGSHPAALGADWLVSAWDQNTVLRQVTPAMAAVEEVAGRWLVDLLGLPAGSGVGFVTGATMANFTGIAAGRDALLHRAGWDPAAGLGGAPPFRVLAGEDRHVSVDVALRYLGLPAATLVAADDQGRMRADALGEALANTADGPTIVLLQAGNLHSGSCDPFDECIPVAKEHGAWVHVDGAFGLWAAASSTYRSLTAGMDQADSWATDAHKTLNVPYDCGIAVVRDAAAQSAAMGAKTDYLMADASGDPIDRGPELSRRARGVPVWAALRAMGRSGVADMIDQMCAHARTFAEAAADIDGAEVLNDVVFTQVSVAFGDDEGTLQVVSRMLEDGTAWMSGSRWRDRAVLRIAVSNATTTDDDVARSIEALRRAAS